MQKLKIVFANSKKCSKYYLILKQTDSPLFVSFHYNSQHEQNMHLYI